MQRQLDGDLDDHEIEALTSHLQQCDQCAAMYERLKLLDAGLENLPKVAPPYSLVDAILPQLAELSAAEHTNGTEQQEKMEPAVLMPSRSERTAVQTVPPKRWQSRRFRTWGGVIAAGFVVGLFIVTYKPFMNDPAAMDKMSGVAADNVGGQEYSRSQQLGPDSDPDEQTENSPLSAQLQESKKDAPTEGQPAAGADTRAFFVGQDKSAEDASSSQPSKAKDEDGEVMKRTNPQVSSPSSGSDANAGSPSKTPTAGTSSRNGGNKSENQDKLKGNNGNPKSNSGDSSSAANRRKDEEAAGAFTIPEQDMPEKGADQAAQDGGKADKMPATAEQSDYADDLDIQVNFRNDGGVKEQPADSEFASPDGRYLAVLLDGQLIVYHAADNKTLYMSDKAEIRNIAWDADSKHVTYETVSEQGSQTVTVDPAAGTAVTSPHKK